MTKPTTKPALNYSGRWRGTYWFPSNNFEGAEPSSYEMQAQRDGDTVVLQSIPNDEQSYMLIRLVINDAVASGSWHETTSASGEFQGANYSGTGQLVVDLKTGNMQGIWVGAGYDHGEQRPRIYTGNWEITRISPSGTVLAGVSDE